MMKICVRCNQELQNSEFRLTGYVKEDGTKSLQSWCRACLAEYGRLPEQRQKSNALQRAKYKEDPSIAKAATYRWVERNRFRVALNRSKADAKIGGYLSCSTSVEELEAAFTGQCDACGLNEEDNGKRLCIDHDHETGEFRGYLCHVCNVRDVLAECA